MLTLDHSGAGGGTACWVKWNGEVIEHFNDSEQLDDEMRVDLTARCEYLESLGVVPRTSTVIWHSGWFKDCPKDSPHLPLLRLCPEFYEHGMTEDTQKRMVEAHCPKYPLIKPDGSVMIVFRNFALLWKDGKVTVLEQDPDEIEGWYHVLAALDYHTARMGQNIFNGCCYAEYPGVLEWLVHHGIDGKAAQDIATLALER